MILKSTTRGRDNWTVDCLVRDGEAMGTISRGGHVVRSFRSRVDRHDSFMVAALGQKLRFSLRQERITA
jgi:hypothetical protein